ncbi:unnamed protein product, partial [Ascophyllum nodosum]
MESPRSRIVVQPCQKAVCNTLQKVLAMIPDRNDLSADRLQMRILALVRSSQKTMEKVFCEFEEIFFKPSVEAHQGYHGNRIPATLTWRDITGSSKSFQEAFRGKVIPTAVESTLSMVKKIANLPDA